MNCLIQIFTQRLLWPYIKPLYVNRRRLTQIQREGRDLLKLGDVKKGTQKDWNVSNKFLDLHTAVCQNLVPLVNIKIAGKWMFIPLKMVLIGIDPYPY